MLDSPLHTGGLPDRESTVGTSFFELFWVTSSLLLPYGSWAVPPAPVGVAMFREADDLHKPSNPGLIRVAADRRLWLGFIQPAVRPKAATCIGFGHP